MKAFALIEHGQAEIIDAPEPRLISEYSAILSPVALSVCTSDVNTVYGSGSKKPDNLILGHEAVAEVIEIGAKVKDFKQGDIVAVPSMTPDWRSLGVQEGNVLHSPGAFSSNALGRSLPGVFAERFLIEDADTTLAKLPEGVGIEDALMCVDMVTTGFRGIEAAQLCTGDSVLVLGIGAVGLMAVRAASLHGAGRIIAVGSKPRAIELARSFGATDILSYKTDNIKDRILDMTSRQGVDVVIICGGDDEVLKTAIDVVKYGIGRVVSLKHFAGDGDMCIPKFSGGRGMSGKTIYMELGVGGRIRMERLLDMVKYGRIKPSELITHSFHGFEHIYEALELMRNKGDNVIKTILFTEWK